MVSDSMKAVEYESATTAAHLKKLRAIFGTNDEWMARSTMLESTW